jgi:hypothetical protein
MSENILEIRVWRHDEDRLVTIKLGLQGKAEIPGWTKERVPLSELREMCTERHSVWSVWRDLILDEGVAYGTDALATFAQQVEATWAAQDQPAGGP